MTRIALIEDNADNRLLVEALLADAYAVESYASGPAALAALPDDPPDLVLLDISLPEMDGIEVLRHLRAHPVLGGLPVIALTAHAMAGDRERLLAAGFDEYVTKPILGEEHLLAPMRRLLAT